MGIVGNVVTPDDLQEAPDNGYICSVAAWEILATAQIAPEPRDHDELRLLNTFTNIHSIYVVLDHSTTHSSQILPPCST